MPSRPDVADLTDLQLAILGALWARKELTIAAIHALVAGQTDVAQKTIATLLTRLERRGLVAHRLNGREGLYRPLVRRRDVLLARASGMLSAFFAPEDVTAGSAAVRKGDVRTGDAERLLELLRRAERDVKGRAK
jgi:BlaI family penicillinase repressor